MFCFCFCFCVFVFLCFCFSLFVVLSVVPVCLAFFFSLADHLSVLSRWRAAGVVGWWVGLGWGGLGWVELWVGLACVGWLAGWLGG